MEDKVIISLSPMVEDTIGAQRAIRFAIRWSEQTGRHCIVRESTSNATFMSCSWIVMLAPTSEHWFKRYFWPWEQIKSWDLFPDDSTDEEVESIYGS